MNFTHSTKRVFKSTDELYQTITFLETHIGVWGNDYHVYYYTKSYHDAFYTKEEIQDFGTLVKLVNSHVFMVFVFKNECDLCLFNLVS